MNKLKQILSNRNTVTFIGVILIAVVIYIFYNWRLNQAISPVKIPYALVDIAPRTKITEDMIGYVEVQRPNGKILTNANTQIVGMYTNVNATIPQGSYFYSSLIVKEEELPDSFLVEIEDGYIPYNFSVDIKSTYGNSMYPGNYVDVYFKGVDDSGLIMLGKLVENVKILAVKDSNGRHVFENMTEERTPSQIIFAVTNDIHLLLRKAEYIKNAEVIIVPTTASFKVDEDEEIVINVTSETIRSYINERSISVDFGE